jgi:pseudouridine kinase
MKEYVCLIGGINLDIKGISGTDSNLADSHRGKVTISPGGVARNISENLSRLDVPVYLLGSIGDDYFGNFILEETKNAGVNTDYIIKSTEIQTSKYLSVSGNNGDLTYAVNDMNESLDLIDVDYIKNNLDLLKKSEMIVLDTNLSKEVLNEVIKFANKNHIPVFIDAVSSSKSRIIKHLKGKINYLSPNINEFETIFRRFYDTSDILEDLNKGMYKNFQFIILKRGKDGIYLINVEESTIFMCSGLELNVTEPNGAGDAFNAGFIYAIMNGCDSEVASKIGICAASFALKSEYSVSKNLSQEILMELYKQNMNNNEF